MSEIAAPLSSCTATLPIPDELIGPTPRPLPYKVALGRTKKIAGRNAVICQVIGIFCWIAWPIPFIQTLSLYLLPLQWLGWIGLLFFGYGIWLVIDNIFNKRRFWAIIHGSAGVGRVIELTKAATVFGHGQPTGYSIIAEINAVNPETGQMERLSIQSAAFSPSEKSTVQPNFRVGDDVILVWRPGEFLESCVVYDFLELVPDHQLKRKGEKNQSTIVDVFYAIGVALAGLLVAFVLLWDLYAVGTYRSITLPWITGMTIGIVGGSILASLGFLLMHAMHQYEKRQFLDRNQKASERGEAIEISFDSKSTRTGSLLLGVAIISMCGLTVHCWALTINAWFDRSIAKPVVINVHDQVVMTYKLVFREYKLKYSFQGSNDEHELMMQPHRLMQTTQPQSIAMVREGYFGWKWIEDVEGIQGPLADPD